MALAISCIFGVPWSFGEHVAHEEEADADGQQGGRRGEHEDEPLAASEVERLVAAFGGKY